MLPKKQSIQFQPAHKAPIKKVKPLPIPDSGCMIEGRVDTNVGRCAWQNDNSGISYKEELKRKKAKKTPKDPTWQAVQFNIVNPTNSPCSFDLFNGYTTTPTPNSPSGYIPQNPNPFIQNPTYYATPALYPNIQCSSLDVNGDGVHSMPLATAYVTSTNRVYVASMSTVANDILVINPATNLVVNTINTSLTSPSWMMVYASVQNYVYLIDTASTAIAVVNCATETFVTNINFSLIGVPSQIAYSAASNRLYVTVPSTNRVYFIDCSLNLVVGSITLTTNCEALGTWTNAGSSYALVMTNILASTAFLINTTSNTLITSFSVTKPNTAGAICYNSTKNSVYYITTGGVVNEIDMSTLAITATSVSGFASSYSLIFLPSYNTIYIDSTTSSVKAHVLDCATNTDILTISTSITSGSLGSRFSYNTLNNAIWMTGNGTNTIVSKLCNNSSATCYITGSYDYTQFLIEQSNCSFEVHSIMIVTETAAAMSVPFEVTKRDADGNSVVNPRLPNTQISTGQFQQNIGYIEFKPKELILDNQTILSSYTIASNSTVKMILYYRQICQADVFSRMDTSVCAKIELKCSDGNSKKTSELNFFAQRPHERPKWEKSFKEKMESNEKQVIPIIDTLNCDDCFNSLGHPILLNEVLSKRYVPMSAIQNLKPIKPIPIYNEVELCKQACRG